MRLGACSRNSTWAAGRTRGCAITRSLSESWAPQQIGWGGSWVWRGWQHWKWPRGIWQHAGRTVGISLRSQQQRGALQSVGRKRTCCLWCPPNPKKEEKEPCVVSMGGRLPSENCKRKQSWSPLWVGVRISARSEPRKTGGYEDPRETWASGHLLLMPETSSLLSSGRQLLASFKSPPGRPLYPQVFPENLGTRCGRLLVLSASHYVLLFLLPGKLFSSPPLSPQAGWGGVPRSWVQAWDLGCQGEHFFRNSSGCWEQEPLSLEGGSGDQVCLDLLGFCWLWGVSLPDMQGWSRGRVLTGPGCWNPWVLVYSVLFAWFSLGLASVPCKQVPFH